MVLGLPRVVRQQLHACHAISDERAYSQAHDSRTHAHADPAAHLVDAEAHSVANFSADAVADIEAFAAAISAADRRADPPSDLLTVAQPDHLSTLRL